MKLINKRIQFGESNRKVNVPTVRSVLHRALGQCGEAAGRQPVIRHRQADVVVVAISLCVVRPADGQDVILR